MVTSILLLLLPSIQSFSLPIWSQKRLQYPSFQMATYDVEAWKNGYESCKKEFCEVISNTIPVNIVGTYFRYIEIGAMHYLSKYFISVSGTVMESSKLGKNLSHIHLMQTE